MLTRLTIANLATIDNLSVELDDGFTVLTGETGAGKSILIDALRFVLGARASSDRVRAGAEQTVVEAVFDLARHPTVRAGLEELGIPASGELTVRRMLQANGRSRAVANDCAITQGKLEELGAYLVNIHGQHDNQMLLNPATHIDFLDAYADLLPLREQVGTTHAAYSRLLRERRTLREQAGERERRREELAEAIEELRAARLQPGEEEELREEHGRLANAEQLALLVGQACQELYEGEAPVVGRLGEIAGALEQAAALDGRLSPQAEQVAPIQYQLEDLFRTLQAYVTDLEGDPNRLEGVNARLAVLEKLKRKYGGSVEEALAWLERAEQELAALERSEEAGESLEAELVEVAGRLHDLSRELSERRRTAAAALDEAVVHHLRDLGMAQAEFETRIAPLQSPQGKTPYYAANGVDQVEFLLNTNPGQQVRPLSRIASGGELSRTMLALKTVLAQADPTTTLIFDEVDAGISGGVAEIVGRKLRGLGASHQVLCVTHLPQIAALSGRHVRVSKHTADGQTYTQVEALDDENKVREVARLLSGIDISERSLASAEEMIHRGRATGA